MRKQYKRTLNMVLVLEFQAHQDFSSMGGKLAAHAHILFFNRLLMRNFKEKIGLQKVVSSN